MPNIITLLSKQSFLNDVKSLVECKDNVISKLHFRKIYTNVINVLKELRLIILDIEHIIIEYVNDDFEVICNMTYREIFSGWCPDQIKVIISTEDIVLNYELLSFRYELSFHIEEHREQIDIWHKSDNVLNKFEIDCTMINCANLFNNFMSYEYGKENYIDMKYDYDGTAKRDKTYLTKQLVRKIIDKPKLTTNMIIILKYIVKIISHDGYNFYKKRYNGHDSDVLEII